MQHSRIGQCAVSTRDLMNNTHARLVRVLFRHWHFCSVTVLNNRELEMRRIDAALVIIRYKHVDFFLDFNVAVAIGLSKEDKVMIATED